MHVANPASISGIPCDPQTLLGIIPEQGMCPRCAPSKKKKLPRTEITVVSSKESNGFFSEVVYKERREMDNYFSHISFSFALLTLIPATTFTWSSIVTSSEVPSLIKSATGGMG